MALSWPWRRRGQRLSRRLTTNPSGLTPFHNYENPPSSPSRIRGRIQRAPRRPRASFSSNWNRHACDHPLRKTRGQGRKNRASGRRDGYSRCSGRRAEANNGRTSDSSPRLVNFISLGGRKPLISGHRS